MKKIKSLILALILSFSIVSCNKEPEHVDYTTKLTLDMSSTTAKEEVTLKQCIDGDTTHFYSKVTEEGVLKARYLGIDTPESTGKIEPWGKQASNFNKSKLQNAKSIIIESDDSNWNVDSTGGRYLVYVWYKLNDGDEYRCLNLELLQEGLSKAKSVSGLRYADEFQGALSQALKEEIKCFSSEKDPLFDYSGYSEVTIKEIRNSIIAYENGTYTSIENYVDYNGKNVRITGIITFEDDHTYYIQDYDAEDDCYYALQVYEGYNNYEPLAVGNEVSLAGVISYSEGFGWQISALFYSEFMTNAKGNMKLLSKDNEVKICPISVTQFDEDATQLMSTYVSVDNLTVVRTKATESSTDSNGALTLYCEDADGNDIAIRTEPFYQVDKDGNIVTKEVVVEGITYNVKQLITGDTFLGETISVKGFVESYYENYQIHVYNMNMITFN